MTHIDRTRRIALLTPLAVAVACAARAGGSSPQPDANVRMADASATADAAPSTSAIAHDLQRTRAALAIDFTGDADIDFVRAMIPMQQGAIAMARVARDYGDDPDVRKLAETIIAQRQTELDWLEGWLKDHDAP